MSVKIVHMVLCSDQALASAGCLAAEAMKKE